MTDKKPLIKQIKDTISPPPTEAQLREKDMIKRWKLKKDPKVPNRYWIDDANYIRFVPADEESVLQAEAILQNYFRGQQIESATPDQIANSPYTKRSGDSIFDKAAEALRPLEPIGRNANDISSSMFSGVSYGSNPQNKRKKRRTNLHLDDDSIRIPLDEDFF